MEASEITVVLKDDSRTYRQKFLMHNIYQVSYLDETILQCINEAKKNFDGAPDEIQIKIHLQVL